MTRNAFIEFVPLKDKVSLNTTYYIYEDSQDEVKFKTTVLVLYIRYKFVFSSSYIQFTWYKTGGVQYTFFFVKGTNIETLIGISI